MRLPFVRRSELDKAEAWAKRSFERMEVLEAENRRLVAIIRLAIRLRRRKRKEKPVPVIPVTSERALAPQVEFAIEQRAVNDPGLRRYLLKYAHDEASKSTAPEEIARRIKYGDDEDEE